MSRHRTSLAFALCCVGCSPNAQGGGSGAGSTGPATAGSTGPATTPPGDTTRSDTGAGSGTGNGSSTTSPATDSTSSTGGSTSDGSCLDHDDCPGAMCFDETCTTIASCLELEGLDDGAELPSGVYELDPDGPGGEPAYEAYCELELMGGGWTLVLKADGPSSTFEYDAVLWTDTSTHQPGFPDLDRNEAKLASYHQVPLTEILLGVEHPIGSDPDPLALQWLPVPLAGDSLHALVSPGVHISTSLGRDAWKGLLAGSSLQPNCNREGINAASDDPKFVGMRIGIIANEQGDCGSADSRLGVGGRSGNYSIYCGTTDEPHGNFAGCGADNGSVSLPAFVVVLVR